MGRHEGGTAKDTLAPITDLWFLAALVLLIVNDHVLKETMPGLVTGKLSDLAGLVVLPVLLGVVLRALAMRNANEIACLTIGVWFAAMKTMPQVARVTERIFESVSGTQSSIVVDATDLVGLIGLVLAIKVLRSPHPLLTGRTLRGGLLVAAVIACAATSNGGGTVQDLGVDRNGGVIRGDASGFETPADLSADDQEAGLGQYATQACLDEEEGGDCFRIVGGKVQRLAENGEWNTEWAMFSAPQIVASVGGGLEYDPSMKATDIVTTPNGTVHVAFDGIAPITRLTTGVWTPPAHSFRPVQVFLFLLFTGFGGVALTRTAKAHMLASSLAASGTLIAIVASLNGIGAYVGGALAVAALGVGLNSIGSGQGFAVPPVFSGIGLIGGLIGLLTWKYWVPAPYLLSITSMLAGGAVVVLGFFLGPARTTIAGPSGVNGPLPRPARHPGHDLKDEVAKISGPTVRPASVPWSVIPPTNEQLEAAAARAAETSADEIAQTPDSIADVNQDPPLPPDAERAELRARLRRKPRKND